MLFTKRNIKNLFISNKLYYWLLVGWCNNPHRLLEEHEKVMDHEPETSDELTFLTSIFKGAIQDSILTN